MSGLDLENRRVETQAIMAAILFAAEEIVSEMSQTPMTKDVPDWCAKKARELWECVVNP